jgi:hypothetical protein
MFLDKQGNVFTCGNNHYGQLGLGDTQARHTPQKVNNIPPMCCLSSCNTAENYMQIVDCEGGVWSCGMNNYGQLGLGHTNTTQTFQRIESIGKLKGKEKAREKENTAEEKLKSWLNVSLEEKQMFKSMEKEQSRELMVKMQSGKARMQVDKDEAKEKIIAGVIGMAEWPSKWKVIHEKNQQLQEDIQQCKVNLKHKQEQLEKLTQEVNEIKQTLSTLEHQKHVVEFYDELLKPIAEAEKELKSGFEEKLKHGKHGDFTLDEVSLFLNVCGMEHLVPHQREHKIDGAILEDAMVDVTVMEIKDKLTRKKMKFYLKVLESGKMANEQQLKQSMVWRHKEVEKTLLLMKEWEIALDEELVRNKGISICELLYFKAKDFKKELGVEGKQAIEMARKLKKMRKDFEEFLQSE